MEVKDRRGGFSPPGLCTVFSVKGRGGFPFGLGDEVQGDALDFRDNALP